MSRFCLFIGISSLTFLFSSLYAQAGYPTLNEWESKAMMLAKQYPDYCRIDTLGKTKSGRFLYALKIGRGEEALKPGIAMVSGVDGRHPAGIYSNIKMAETILNSKDSLWMQYKNNMYFYFIPVVNADAFAEYKGIAVTERKTNNTPVDDDKDGRTDEDPGEDLNKDGYITEMRIKSPQGTKMADSVYQFLAVDWDKKSTTKDRYLYLSEGIDNDRDGKYNEDGTGGVDINANFSFNYPAFSANAGGHAFSENETRAIGDYLFDRFNIYAVFTMGLENTLSDPVKHDKQKNAKRIILSPLEKDGAVNEWVSDLYKKSSALENPVTMAPGQGSFSQWAYFHYGRFSYATPVWLAPVLKEAKPAEESEKNGPTEKEKQPKGKKEAPVDSYDTRYVKWADSMKIQDYFVPWSRFDHPDFPDKEVEIGGFKPYVRYNPPTTYLDENIAKHVQFLGSYIESMPRLTFESVKVEKLDEKIYRVTGKVVNSGLLATHTELGDKTKWVRKIRHRILLNKNQQLLINKNRSFHSSLQPGESFTFSWLVQGEGKLVLEAGSPMTGIITKNIDLK
jgi:hypothetical protein